MTNATYDPILYIHWLYWRLRCMEGSGQDFQRLFESVAARCRDGFVRIRAYGKLGDRKCDGLYWGDGTVYQVYSPDQMKESTTRKKIEEDLSGAVNHWGGELKRWVFVYNARRGLAPDVARLIQNQRKRYADIVIEPMSDDDLWKQVQKLPIQDRIEILGPPPGYEALFPLADMIPEEIKKRLQNCRIVVVQEVLSPINVADAVKAMEPARPFGPPLFIQPPSESASWELAATYQRTVIDDALRRSRDHLPRFAIFSLSPIPLAFHLGFLLSDRVEVEAFQFDRDRKTWKWDPCACPGDMRFTISGIPKSVIKDPVEIILRLSLSAPVWPEDTAGLIDNLAIEIDMSIENPSLHWLCSPLQLTEFGRSFRKLLAEIQRLIPNCTRIHLFYAGPTGTAIVAGQAINPRMNAPVILYQYNRQRTPRYSPALTLA